MVARWVFVSFFFFRFGLRDCDWVVAAWWGSARTSEGGWGWIVMLARKHFRNLSPWYGWEGIRTFANFMFKALSISENPKAQQWGPFLHPGHEPLWRPDLRWIPLPIPRPASAFQQRDRQGGYNFPAPVQRATSGGGGLEDQGICDSHKKSRLAYWILPHWLIDWCSFPFHWHYSVAKMILYTIM